MPNEKLAGQMDEKSQKNAKPNTKSTGQSAFKKAKFQLFSLKKCQMTTLSEISLLQPIVKKEEKERK